MKHCIRFSVLLFISVFAFLKGHSQCTGIDFKSDVSKGCNPLVVKFYVVNYPAGSTFEWDFGSGYVSGKDTVYKIFTSPGKYSISLRVTLKNGTICSAITKSNMIEVLASPVPKIGVVPGKTLCSGSRKITFIDSTTGSTSRDWIINGKSYLNGSQSITDSFLTTGYKSLVVKVSNSYGCNAIFSDNKYINVTDSAAADFCAIINQKSGSITANYTPSVYSPNRTVSSYNWSFSGGSPSSSSASNPGTISYATSGTYDVSLTVKLSDGCVFSKSIKSFIQPPFIGKSRDSVCMNEVVVFTNKINNNGRKDFAWLIDGKTSNDTGWYANAGYQDFSLEYKYPSGSCTNKVVCTGCVKVKGPKADFTSTTNVKCSIGDTIHIINKTDEFAAGKVTYTWYVYDTFGKLYSTIGPTAKKDLDLIFPKYGVWHLRLQAKGASGCTDTITKKKYLYVQKPKADFKPDTNIICTGKNIQLKNLTFPPDTKNNPYKYTWIIQHSDSAPVITMLTIKSPSFQPSLPGEYDVTLIVQSVKGCSDTLIKKRYFKVNGQIVELKMNKSVGCPPLTAMAYATMKMKYPNTSANVQKYTWTSDPVKGDSLIKIDDSTYQIDFKKSGCYSIKVELKDSNQCKNYDNKSVCLGSGSDFTLSMPGCLGTPTNLTANPNPVPDKYKWTVKPSAHAVFLPSDTVANPTITFNKDTFYTITLSTTKTSNGLTCTGSNDTFLHVGGIQPNIIPTVTTAYCAPAIVTFKNYTKNANKYYWDFGDGTTTITDTQIITSHLYTKNSPLGYIINIKMLDSSLGCSLNYVLPVNIKIIGPAPKFLLSQKRGCDSFNVTFKDTSLNIKSYIFNYDDGSTQLSNKMDPHTYKINKASKLDSQTFYPVMVALDAKNCKNFHKDTVRIYRSPTAIFSGYPQNGCLPFSVTFTDSSKNVAKRYWDFNGDGITDDSVSASPTFTYTSPGLYDVSLRVMNKAGCSNTLKKYGYISSLPSPGIKITQSQHRICEKANITFINNSTYYDHFSFDYGDGTAKDSDIIKPHTYAYDSKTGDSTIFILKTVMINNNGCKSTKKDTLIAYPKTHGGFSFSNVTGCSPLNVQLNDTSINGGLRKWDFNSDGIIDDTIHNPKHIFTPGKYSVTMYAGSIAGCSDTIFKKDLITSWTPPLVDFISSDSLICAYNNVKFTNLSKSSEDTIVKYLWKFDESKVIDTSSAIHPDFTYYSSGKKKIILSATDSRGCTTSLTKSLVRVKDSVPPANPDFYFVTVADSYDVNVIWKKNTLPGFSKYSLFRTDTITQLINTSFNRSDTSYTDMGIDTRKRSYCYNITATDDCNLTGNLNKKHCTIPLKVKPVSGIAAEVSWSRYIGWDSVLSYTLYRNEQGKPDTVLGIFNGGTLAFTDTGLCDKKYTYRVIGTSLKGGYKSASNYAEIYLPYVYQDTALPVHFVTVENDNHLLVSWKKSKQQNVRNYALYKTELNSVTSPEKIYTSDTFFKDSKVDLFKKIYAYRVDVSDRCGNTSTSGSTGQSILLKTKTVNDKFHLYWTHYRYWEKGVKNYTVQIRQRNKAFINVVDIPGTDSSYVFDSAILAIDTAYCFRIIAHENFGRGDSSVSNTSCGILDSRVFLPNAFTPNSDNLNDTWKPSALFIYNQTGLEKLDYSLEIFNRWGELIFKTKDINQGWNGEFLGAKCPVDVYTYIIKAEGMDKKSFFKSGTISLLRN